MELKLDLYRRFCVQQHRGHLIIRGFTGKELDMEIDRLTQLVTVEITEVPRGWSVQKLHNLLNL